tara:strand:+ start:656 stop:793 length:138 start_codon:yes stop_codon:yes gene_type:complete
LNKIKKRLKIIIYIYGAVAELVDAGDSKSPGAILESSSLSSPTIL